MIEAVTATPSSREGDLERSFAICRRIVQAEATNFGYGMRLVPEPKRSATYALYAWLRRADDLADGEGEAAEKAGRLKAFWAQTQCCADAVHEPSDAPDGGSLWPAFGYVVHRYGLPMDLLGDHIKGQFMDQGNVRYATLNELYDYCHKVAAVVGLLCIRIWGYEGGESTCRLAESRGVAFQLTNILRDVREDALRGRIYIPGELLGGREAKPELFTGAPAAGMEEVITAMADRAAGCYAASAGLEQRVHPDGRNCLWAMTQVYSRLLDRIRHDPAVVLRGPRLRLARSTKLWIALRALCR